MQFLYRTHAQLIEKYGRKKVLLVATLLGVIVALIAVKLTSNEQAGGVIPAPQKSVVTASVRDLMTQGSTIEVLGTVEAVNEARLITEAGGRVTSVPVALGDTVAAGAVIATIENSRERAAVLQAEGVYEAARAAAATSDIGSASAERAYSEALTQAMNAYRGAFAAADNVLRNTVDQVYSNPDGGVTGVRIENNGRSQDLITERRALEIIFDDWEMKVRGSAPGDLTALLSKAEDDVARLSALVVTLTSLLADDDAYHDEAILLTLREDFAAARSATNGTSQSLSTARTALSNAKTTLDQARIAATQGDVSLAEAQVKQALGALRLAQANLEKTIIRSPIAGTVNTLTLKVGSTISPGTPAAVISSSGGLQIVAYVNESDASRVAVGSQAIAEGSVQGVVTQVATGIDTVTKKIQVKIGLSQSDTVLLNGQTVNVSIESVGSAEDTDEEVTLPVVSIKMTPEGPVVFTVENGKLAAHPVTLGAIIGDHIVIEEGIDQNFTIVTDARGLRAGESVTVN